MTWGGDNTGNGFESVFINLIEFKNQFPSENTITIDMNAMWYGDQGSQPVVIKVTMYKGGTVIPLPDLYTFTNVSYTNVFGVESLGTSVSLQSQTCEDQEHVASLQYNLSTYQGQFL